MLARNVSTITTNCVSHDNIVNFETDLNVINQYENDLEVGIMYTRLFRHILYNIWPPTNDHFL